MAIQLVVLKQFLSYKKGDIITDPDHIQQALDAGYARFVLKVAVQDVTGS